MDFPCRDSFRRPRSIPSGIQSKTPANNPAQVLWQQIGARGRASPMDNHDAAKACWGREPSPHVSENHPTQMSTESIHSDPPSEMNLGVTMLQYTQLLQQVQILTVAVHGLQQSVLHAPPAPPEMRQPLSRPSPIALVLEDHPCVKINHQSIFKWSKLEPSPCFFLAMEVIVGPLLRSSAVHEIYVD